MPKSRTLTALGIPTAKTNQFRARGIETFDDLLQYFPKDYIDCRKETGLLPENEVSVVSVLISGYNANRTNSGKDMVTAKGQTRQKQKVCVIWFNQKWQLRKAQEVQSKWVLVVGKAKYSEEYDSYTIINPALFEIDMPDIHRMYPIYKKIPGMSQQYLADSITKALSGEFGGIEDPLPSKLVQQHDLMSYSRAIHCIHSPKKPADIKKAQERILFNDLLYFALCMTLQKRRSATGSPYNIPTTRVLAKIKETLPYALTDDQAKAVDDMIQAAREGKRINALLQGDVGCGKSIVAFIMMLLMADNGCQSVLMAPTQVLARQHYEDLSLLAEPFGFQVAFIHSGMKASEKRSTLASILDGSVKLIVGTHSVIGKDVVYDKLALTIADEEHRFGVSQRETLASQASNGVHTITMSATPIPRSLASVIYGDAVQLLTITTMPTGRMPVITAMSNGREKIYRFIVKQAQLHRQVYVVCPVIDKNDDLEGVKSVEEVSEEYHKALDSYGVKIATLTGRTSAAETETTIQKFKNAEIDVLISTTIIEVGVNVPTATAIVITNAERFGLSSLHQLRGRVGRGIYQSYCVLEAANLTEKGKQRMEVMCHTNNGFEIAEADLKIRGAGDFLGTKQSGDDKYMSLMMANQELYEEMKPIAADLLDKGEDSCRMTAEIVAKFSPGDE